MKNKDKITFLFNKIKTGHQYYVAGDNDYRIRLAKALEPVFAELETLGVERAFSETLLIAGKEFVDSLKEPELNGNVEATVEDAEKIFGAKATDMDDVTARASKLAQKHGITTFRIVSENPLRIENLSTKK